MKAYILNKKSSLVQFYSKALYCYKGFNINYIFRVFIPCLIILIISCEKEPGFGGLASISGRVYAYDYNTSGIFEGEGYTGDIDVFIKVQGDNKELERVRTDLEGRYRFDELRKGTYVIWVYSYCDECTNNQEAFTKTIKIDGRKEKVELDDFKVDI